MPSKEWRPREQARAAFCLEGTAGSYSDKELVLISFLLWSLPPYPGYGKVTFSEILAHLLYSLLNIQ